jgi:D-hydroxyproline dehydrogenase subunit gamma
MLRYFTEPESDAITVLVEGQPFAARSDESVAAVLLRRYGADYRVSSVGADTRAPYCLMGVCFECLVEVDGVPNRQGCLVPVREGMVIVRQLGRTKVD